MQLQRSRTPMAEGNMKYLSLDLNHNIINAKQGLAQTGFSSRLCDICCLVSENGDATSSPENEFTA